MADKPVTRKIYYYDLILKVREGEQGGKRTKKKTVKDQGEKLKKIFMEIKEKQDRVAQEKEPSKIGIIQKELEMTLSNQSKLYVIVDDISGNGIIKFRIVLCRNNAFPFVYKNGKLELLTENVAGTFELAEITHCIIYTEKMIMGGEFNFHGARPSSIAAYISYKVSEVAFLECEGKLNNDSIDKIVEGKKFSLFDFSIKNSEDIKNKLVKNQFSFVARFAGAPEDVGEYEVIWKKKRGSKSNGFDSPFTNEEYKRLVQNFREDIGKLRVSQGIQTDSIDLLNDKLVHKVSQNIETMHKSIVSEYIYNEINDFYHEVVENY